MPIARARCHTPHHFVLHYFRKTAGLGRRWRTSGITRTSTSSTNRPSLNSWFSWPLATGSCPPTAPSCSTYRGTVASPPRLRPRMPRKLLEMCIFKYKFMYVGRRNMNNIMHIKVYFCQFHSYVFRISSLITMSSADEKGRTKPIFSIFIYLWTGLAWAPLASAPQQKYRLS